MQVKLLERGRFIITDDNNAEHKGRFCAGAIDRFCSLNGIENIIDFYSKIPKMLVRDHANLIICAMEYEQELDNIYTTRMVLDWIDDMGGIMSENFTDLLRHETHAMKTPDQKKMPASEATVLAKAKSRKK